MNKTKKPNLIILAVFTTITVFGWIFFEVYRKIKDVPGKSVNQELLTPISPNLDTKSLERIKNGIHLTEEEIDQNSEVANQGSLVIESQETQNPPTEATESGNITPTPLSSPTPPA